MISSNFSLEVLPLLQFFNTHESQVGSTAVLFNVVDFALKAVNFGFQHDNVLVFLIKVILKILNCVSSHTFFFTVSREIEFFIFKYGTVVKNSNDFHNELIIVSYLFRGAWSLSFRHDWRISCCPLSACPMTGGRLR